MKFVQTDILDVILVCGEPVGDARGHFVRTYCAREMAEAGLALSIAQASHSVSAQRGTLRGLHFQAHPAMESKLVRCERGSIFDVMVDLRPASPTFGRWVGFELSDSNHRQLYAPRGFAHGFQTLTNDAVVGYQIAPFYEADKSTGVRFDDPDIGIAWPLPPVNLSPRDMALPRLADIDTSKLLPSAAKS